MKLACVRCKQRKTKCDRGEPTCHQCILAKAECQYVERRKRPKLAQQKVEFLSKRLEQLERQIASGEAGDSLTPEDSVDQEASPDSTPVPSPTVSLLAEDGQESWIYRMATDARRNFQANAQSQAPTNEPTPQLDSAMSTLNEALDDLGKLRIRPSVEAPMNSLQLSPQECEECIESFVGLLDYLVIPDVFTSFLDWSVIRSIPNIVDSPYVKIDPVVKVMYWNAIHYGLDTIRGPGNKFAQAAYLKVLENVPAWLDSATGSDIDFQTAGLTTWTAINNLDYQLSYKFHCKACQFLKIKGADHLDLCLPKTHEEEERRVSIRYMYWQILSTDLLFRLFFGKPTILRWTPKKVKPPTIFSTQNMRPKVPQVILTVVWIQYTLMTAEIMSLLDKAPEERDQDLPSKVNQFSMELEELITDWNLLSLIQDEKIPTKLRYMIADHVMNIYAVIIGVERLVRPQNQDHPVNAISLRSARKVVDIILHFYASPVRPNETPSVFVLCGFISFYPFCAVFSLYEHILACADPDDCEQDLQSLENMGLAIQHACDLRSDFMPLSRTLNALNQVSRSFQDARRKKTTYLLNTSTPSSGPSDAVRTPSSQTDLLQQHIQNQTQQQGLNLPSSVAHINAAQNLANPMFDFSGSGLPFFPSMPNDGDFQAQGFVRAVENGFIAKNWHEDWWDMGGMSSVD